MTEKILFGDLSRQLRKVLDWRSLLVFSIAAPVGGILINLAIGMRLIDARVSPDFYISIMNVLYWIPPLVAIQITYLIRKYLVRRNEGRILGEISRRNVIGLFNSPIVVVLVGLVITGSLEAYLFWWLGRGFQFTNVYEFWAWSEITWSRWTPFLLTIAGTFWLLRESEKDRAEYMGLEFTKYPALRRYRQRTEFALEAIIRMLSSLWTLITTMKKDGSQSISKESDSQVASDIEVSDLVSSSTPPSPTVNSFIVAVYTGASVSSRLEEAQEASESVEDWRDAVFAACTDLVEEIASRLDGYKDCLVGSLEGGISDQTEVLGQYPTPILEGTLDSELVDGFILYLCFDERHDSDVINEEFLSMDDWGFGAYWIDENDQVRSQNYDFGEFDTGYYAALEWGDDESDYLDAAFQPQIGLRKAAKLLALETPQKGKLSASPEPEPELELEPDSEYRFYIKTEPSGEVACSVLSVEETPLLIRQLLEGDQVEVERLQDAAREYSVCGLLGIFGSGGETDFDEEPRRNFGEHYSLPKDSNGNYEPGIYVVLSALSKASLELAIPGLNATNIGELELSYESFEFPVKHPTYGKLNASVLTGIDFNWQDFDHSEIVDRGYDIVTHVLLAYGRKRCEIISYVNEDAWENHLEGKDGLRNLIFLATYSLDALHDPALARDILESATDLAGEQNLKNKVLLDQLDGLREEIVSAEALSESNSADSVIAESQASSDVDGFVVAVYTGASVSSRLEEAQEASESVEDWRDAVFAACTDLVEEIASRLDGYKDCLVGSLEGGISDQTEVLGQYPTPILEGTLDSELVDGFILYLCFDERHDSDVINEEFLSMDDWGFGAYWIDENDQVRSQNYDFGEFDTGYYAALEWGDDESDYLDAAFQPQIGLRKAAKL